MAELVKRRITEEVVRGGVMTIRLVIERRGLEIDEFWSSWGLHSRLRSSQYCQDPGVRSYVASGMTLSMLEPVGTTHVRGSFFISRHCQLPGACKYLRLGTEAFP